MSKVGSFLVWSLAATLTVSVGSCIFRQGEAKNQQETAAKITASNKAAIEAAKSPEQRASEAKAAAMAQEKAATAKNAEEAEFQFGVRATKSVRASLKNPNSFQLVGAGVVPGGALCLTYRATNSFNAVITERVAVTRKFAVGEWNKECAGKRMPDLHIIKHAI